MATLHIKRVTPRVVLNRRPVLLSWKKFEAALNHVSQHSPEQFKTIPKHYWVRQLNLWNKRYRGSDLHKLTYSAAEYAMRFPMGH